MSPKFASLFSLPAILGETETEAKRPITFERADERRERKKGRCGGPPLECEREREKEKKSSMERGEKRNKGDAVEEGAVARGGKDERVQAGSENGEVGNVVRAKLMEGVVAQWGTRGKSRWRKGGERIWSIIQT